MKINPFFLLICPLIYTIFSFYQFIISNSINRIKKNIVKEWYELRKKNYFKISYSTSNLMRVDKNNNG